MAADDRALVERVVAGDAEAFEALFARYREAVGRHIRRMVRHGGAADDLVQEAFLRVWTRGEQWDGRGSFRGWLFRIATNLALNHLRSVRRRRQRPLEPPPEPLGDEDDEPMAPAWMIDASALGPDAVVELAEERELCRRLIDRLPEDKREVFRMAHEAEMPVREIAEALGIPVGTVKSRLHYAAKRLASEWQHLGGD